jgi:hypothetical protein
MPLKATALIVEEIGGVGGVGLLEPLEPVDVEPDPEPVDPLPEPEPVELDPVEPDPLPVLAAWLAFEKIALISAALSARLYTCTSSMLPVKYWA